MRREVKINYVEECENKCKRRNVKINIFEGSEN